MNLLHLSSHTSSPRPLRPIVVVPAVKPGDAAVAVMTDFAHEQPITVGEGNASRIEDALEDIDPFRRPCAAGVPRGDTVTGLITSYDVQGERPMKFLQSSTPTGTTRFWWATS